MVRANRSIRERLEAAPPRDFPDVVLDERATPAVVPDRRRKMRRDRRHLEDDEYIAVDIVTGEKVVKTGKRAAMARGDPIVIALEEEEYIDEFEVVTTGWKRRDAEERTTPAPPVRAVLKPDEYVDEDSRLRVRNPRESLPPRARTAVS